MLEQLSDPSRSIGTIAKYAQAACGWFIAQQQQLSMRKIQRTICIESMKVCTTAFVRALYSTIRQVVPIPLNVSRLKAKICTVYTHVLNQGLCTRAKAVILTHQDPHPPSLKIGSYPFNANSWIARVDCFGTRRNFCAVSALYTHGLWTD